jgi:DNA-binding IclR family transcriptional regulator
VIQEESSARAYPVQVLDRAFAILEFLGERPARLPEISKGVGLHRATVFRLLTNLEQKGYVRRLAPQGPFALGAKTFELGTRVFQSEYPAHQVRHLLAELAERTGQTSQVWIRSGEVAICVDQCDSPSDLKVVSRVGRNLPLNCAAPGKVLLAFAPPEVRERVLASALPALSELTITDPVLLARDIELTRRQGYTFATGEVSPVMAGLAAPVFNARGEVAAAINLLGTISDLTPETVSSLLPVLLETTAAVSAELGYLPGRAVSG